MGLCIFYFIFSECCFVCPNNLTVVTNSFSAATGWLRISYVCVDVVINVKKCLIIQQLTLNWRGKDRVLGVEFASVTQHPEYQNPSRSIGRTFFGKRSLTVFKISHSSRY